MGVLVLNATFEPLGVVSTHRAMTLVVRGKVSVVAVDSNNRVLRSASGEVFQVPSVVVLNRYVRVPYRRVPLTRRMILARDSYVCQVVGCNARATTIDHVVPRSRGGQHRWNNVVGMCSPHNHRKGSSQLAELGWTLKARPVIPQVALVMGAQDPTWEPFLDPQTSAQDLLVNA